MLALQVSTDPVDDAFFYKDADQQYGFIGFIVTDNSGNVCPMRGNNGSFTYLSLTSAGSGGNNVLTAGNSTSVASVFLLNCVPAGAREANIQIETSISGATGSFEFFSYLDKYVYFFLLDGGPVGGPHAQFTVPLPNSAGPIYKYRVGASTNAVNSWVLGFSL